MRKFLRPAPLSFAMLTSCLTGCLMTVAIASYAAEEAPSARDVEQARRCAAETRIAGRAFSEVRDSVRAGGTTRAEALLTVAENALRDARAACVGNEEVSAQLELLTGEAAGLRQSLGSSQR